jgi:hypothetical protein
VCDEWISTLQTTLSILYTKSPLFSQEFLRVHLMDGTFTTMPLTENTKVRDVVKFMCKKHALNNESEWGLLEFWDHPGINGILSERKLPGDELLLDQTMLTWEQAARKRYGLVNSVPHAAFKLVLRKVTALLPQARTGKGQLPTSRHIHISPHLATSPHISPHLATSRHVSPPSRHVSNGLRRRAPRRSSTSSSARRWPTSRTAASPPRTRRRSSTSPPSPSSRTCARG